MALNMTAEERETGKQNFQETSADLTRRGFMKSMVAAGAVTPVAAGVYFGYRTTEGKPVKAALIGCGDEGGVLLGEHNPEYLQFVAACDIRPYNQKRIVTGDPKVPLRKGFTKVYGETFAQDIAKNHMYTDYIEMLDREKDLEAVVIALPLHLHAPVAIECMNRGLHVLCEKLMARTITQCKDMVAAAKKNNVILSIGHQRHYSMLYAHATDLINSGVIGDIKHIRALWHRNFSWDYVPEKDSPALAISPDITQPKYRDGWFSPIYDMDYQALVKDEFYKKLGYRSIEELIRWRLYNRTGGGLMAELGSHQMDACSIFLGKVQPLSVTGVGGKFFFGPGRNDRSTDDHVFTTFEFPGKNHPRAGRGGNDKNDVVVVTYSSINTNGFEAYGETLMGTRGSMVVEGEQSIMLYKEREPLKKTEAPAKSMAVAVGTAGAGKPVLEAASTWGGPPAAAGGAAVAGGAAAAPAAISRGYREEMEDFAYCIRQWKKEIGWRQDAGRYVQRLPKCHGEIAMADAIIALTANIAMDRKQRIEFSPEWFKADAKDVPDSHIDPETIVG